MFCAKNAIALKLGLVLLVALNGSVAAEVEGVIGQEADEIVRLCDYKSPGQDQRSMLEISLINAANAEKKSIYRRLWKDSSNEGELFDKMVLYTVFPPEGEGTGFLRWGYKANSGKAPDQWLYLPSMKKIRRVSVRDPGDSFLGSDLSYGDIDDRSISADQHELVSDLITDEFFVVDSRPVAEPKLYSKRRSWYKKGQSWADCHRVKTEFYDKSEDLLKVQELSWQAVSGAWAWDVVTVRNIQTGHSSIFKVYDVEFNVNLSDRLFTERELRRGYRE